jgi:hypothetical protein
MAQDFLLEGDFDTGDFVVQLREGAISIVREEDIFCYQSPLEDGAFWVFDASGKRYAVLWKYQGSGVGNSAQAASSSDNGASWIVQDEANGPAASTYGASPVSVDHMRPASSATKLTVGARQQDTAYTDGDGYHEPFRLYDFDFAAQTWGAAYAEFYMLRPAVVLMSSRPDGSILIVYREWNVAAGEYRLCYSIWNGTSWTHYDSGEWLPTAGARSLVVDDDGRAHVFFNSQYVQIAADGTFGTPEDLTTLFGSAWPMGNLMVSSGGELLVPAMTSGMGMIRGYPLASPSWDWEEITDSVGFYDWRSGWVTQEADGRIAIYWNSPDGSDQRTYKAVRNAEDDWQAKELMWDSGDTPPQTSPPASSCSAVYAIIVLPAAAAPAASRGWAVISRGIAGVNLSGAGGYGHCG